MPPASSAEYTVRLDTATSAPTPRSALRRRLAVACLAILLLYAGAAAFDRAARKPFWHDEVFTLTTANQGSLPQLWAALYRGLDSNPPLFHVIEAAVARPFPDPQQGYRFPSLLGVLLASAALFCLVRRRAGGIPALIAAVVPLLTALFGIYAVEARPYGLVAGCLAVAMVMWQQCDRPGRTVLLAAFLGLAVGLHYYAVCALLPFVLAEAAAAIRLRKLRLKVWLAFAAAGLPLAITWPLLAQFKLIFGGHFWAKVISPGLVGMYDHLLASHLALPVALALGVATLALLLHDLYFDSGRGELRTPLPEEWLLILALIFLPAIELVPARLAHVAITARYALPAVLGVATAAAYLAHRAGRWTSRAVLAALLLLFGIQETRYWTSRPPVTSLRNPARSIEEMVQASGKDNLPVVVSSGLEYLPAAYYSSRQGSGRFVSLVDPQEALARTGSDTIERAFTILAAYRPLKLQPFPSFVQQHRDFLLYSNGDLFDWWPARLKDGGYTLQPLTVRDGRTLYFVSRH